MNKGEIFYIITEIFFAIFIILFGSYIWDGFDQTDYKIAKYYDKTREVDLIYESNMDNGYVGNNIVVSVHNISDKINNKEVIFKLNKTINLNSIKINQSVYNLNDIFMVNDENYNYYLIENANLEGYETRVYFIDLLSEDTLYDYQFITEL